MIAAVQYESHSRLTVPAAGRPIGMSRSFRQIATLIALACAFASVKVMANPNIRRPVVQFIYFYEQTDQVSDAMNIWERVVYSLLLAKTTEPSS
jgi:hypothetical protein